MVNEDSKELTIDELASFCKRRGFVYPSGEIYGGLAGFWDFGHLGTELLNNIKKAWWEYFVYQKENIVGIDSSIISNPKIWKASGHLANFNVSDYLVTCTKCKKSNKVDKSELKKIKCACGGEFDWGRAKIVEQMFKTVVGSDQTEVYLRGENAQGMFANFKSVQENARMKLPFGIAQIGKCFRNEIAPRDFLFRDREFTIGEFEFFIAPDELKCPLLDKEHLNLKINFLNAEEQEKGKSDLQEMTIEKMIKEKRLDEWHGYWLAEQIMFLKSLGLNVNKIKIREHMKGELSHYSSATFDLDYDYPFGSKEVAGIANRGQFDLTQHAKASNQKIDYFDEEKKTRVVPRVIEPTFGMDRIFLAAIVDAYDFDKKRENIVLHLLPKLAPIKAAVFPIVKGEKYERICQEILKELRKEFNVHYDESGSIGRRYARNDEIGTPYCITIDEDSVKDESVTIRDRDTTKQIRVKIDGLRNLLRRLINGEVLFEKAGKLVETRVK